MARSRSSLRAAAKRFGATKGFTPEFVDGLLQETARDSSTPTRRSPAWWTPPKPPASRASTSTPSKANASWPPWNSRRSICLPTAPSRPENLEFNLHPTWEIAYNHFHDRLGFSLPEMAAVLPAIRPTGVNHHMAWETLTHAGMAQSACRR